MKRRDKVFLLIIGLASPCHAETALVPAWLPPEYRFAVEGTSNDVAQVSQTLALMRDAIHPRLKAQMNTAALGAALQWTVHVLQPNITNDTAYFNTYKPTYKLTFNHALLTNRISRLTRIPTSVNLKLVYGLKDKTRSAVEKALPGVDYPGVAFEDEGSTSNDVRLVLRAPKNNRRFRLETSSPNAGTGELEFHWVKIRGSACMERTGRASRWGCWNVYACHSQLVREGEAVLAVFVREKGGFWGTPSFIRISAEELGRRSYLKNGDIAEIDYGTFRDIYAVGERGVVLGFERVLHGEVRGQRYSNLGELIVESYSDDRPKITRKVRYYMDGNRLNYTVLDGLRHYKNETEQMRSLKW